ncbi:DNA replication/repair protein RecF [Rheinheimera baltica]|uniref:DNA replication and repair protein RecF n=1 Tax=Rheinheimera baltica TaxID=67576 RepID=A0ABT9HXI8_9GAMM|nr:DNA replication/repair protein RecF [Rheinheimera baltica]MDP5135839.1 DNA replication/repair protein RecF [Rheinheimera baltica]MDP5143761.1 DNA replication/repair protein RecF [Rheinheimera baltica]MDP5151858.1 DNA replication/repair protein RecF [Rheinheimera baltica]MDP5188764.1 DNA replication/repair protein RecF [Rheinheimera baltica]
MSLLSVNASQFRNLTAVSFNVHAQFNLIVGMNGSGKTSLLEAIYYLAHGRSFRTSRSQRLIQHNSDAFVIHAKVAVQQQIYSLGLQRDKQGELLLRLNGSNVNRLAEIASLLPVQLITPDSFRLFFGGPKERRQFFDMGLFHVEQSFFDYWLRFNKVLKQRNALLKTNRHYDSQFEFWDQQFVELAFELQRLRYSYVAQLESAFRQLTTADDLMQSLNFQLQQGWPEKVTTSEEFKQLLHQSFSHDSRMGFTQYGPQKADLRIKKDQWAAEEVLSRGQLKVLLFALKIAQNNVIRDNGQKQPLLLIDDLASELDQESTRQIFSYLRDINSQVFITAINADHVSPFIDAGQLAMFHVEHGQLTARTDDDGRTT